MRLVRTLLLAACSVGLALPAAAADLPRAVYKAPQAQVIVSPWAGFYAGIGVGYGQSSKSTAITGTEPIGRAIVDIGAIPSSIDPNEQGWTIGGQLGYRWQTGMFVYGAEAEINWSNIDGSASHLLTAQPLGLNASLATAHSSSLDWYGTVTGTLGVALGERALIYAKGGFAYGGISHSTSHTLKTPIPVLNASASGSSDADTGFVIGGGAEFALLQNVTLGFEYNYLDFGNSSVSYDTRVLGTRIGFNADRDNIYHVVKARINYRF